MRSLKKIICLSLAAGMLTFYPLSAAKAQPGLIYEKTSKEQVTSGVFHESIKRFTSEGWLNINVMRIDLTNPYIKLDTLINQASLMKLSGTKQLAESQGAVAAINGGFFNWERKAEGGYPDGPVVKSGSMVTAASEYNKYNDSMATFAIDASNKPLISYWKTDMSLTAPNGVTIPVTQFNKPSKDYSDITVIDSRWGASSIGASSEYGDIVEMVVRNGRVVEIRQSLPATSVPQDGFIVVTRSAGSSLPTGNFTVGSQVKFNISTSTDWNGLKMAVTGSAVLVRDGSIPDEFSFNIPGRNPRTSIGSTEDGKQLILAAVDGRQNSSIGMTQLEMAQLMLELGAYNAVNMDGGGSTTMVSRTPGSDGLQVVNSPSDGSQRPVSTAVGVFSTAPAASLQGFTIETSDTNIFKDTSREFKIKGYDKYHNPVKVDAGQILWSVEGLEGSFSGNSFTPSSVGTGKVRASLGDATSTLEIRALPSPVQLFLSLKSLDMEIGQKRSLAVYGIDKDGFRASVNSNNVNWSISGDIGSFKGDVLSAERSGTGIIYASVGEAHSYCSVSVLSSGVVIKDGFEKDNASFSSYPAAVKGDYEISSGQKHSGITSGKLTYDFTQLEGTRAAYVVFDSAGIALDNGASKFGVWIYNDHLNSNWLRAELQDASGEKRLIDLSKNMDWTGWKHVEASLEGIKQPSRLTKIYLAQVAPVPDSGSIYLDDLTVSVPSSGPKAASVKLPAGSLPADRDYKVIPDYQPSKNSFRFSVFGEVREPSTAVEKNISAALVDKINKYIEAAAFAGNSLHNSAKLVQKPTISNNTGYKSFDILTSRFIQLDTGKKSLRLSDPVQWNWLQERLNSFSGENIFIFPGVSPSQFTDPLEADLFKETLEQYKKQTGKNIWVFLKESTNTSYMENGIKYISSAGFDIEGLSDTNVSAAKYVLVTVTDGKATFEIKPVVSY